MAKEYRNYKHLVENEIEGVDYKIYACDQKSHITIIAPHGGKIEPGTSDITKHLASDEFNYYSFEGIKQEHNRDLHITSTNFDEPLCIDLVKKSKRVIAIHGKRGDEDGIFMGGRDRDLKGSIRKALKDEGFDARNETDPKLSAKSLDNICNKGASGQGVQLEIHRGLRNKLREDSALMNKFCDAIRSAIKSMPIL